VVVAARYTQASGEDELSVKWLVEPSGGMLLPVNMMLIDRDGEAGRVLISKEGVAAFH
jgi:hypothetical protein